MGADNRPLEQEMNLGRHFSWCGNIHFRQENLNPVASRLFLLHHQLVNRRLQLWIFADRPDK